MREDPCGHRSYACVWPDQCKESKLITDGEGIINIRILPEVCKFLVLVYYLFILFYFKDYNINTID